MNPLLLGSLSNVSHSQFSSSFIHNKIIFVILPGCCVPTVNTLHSLHKRFCFLGMFSRKYLYATGFSVDHDCLTTQDFVFWECFPGNTCMPLGLVSTMIVLPQKYNIAIS